MNKRSIAFLKRRLRTIASGARSKIELSMCILRRFTNIKILCRVNCHLYHRESYLLKSLRRKWKWRMKKSVDSHSILVLVWAVDRIIGKRGLKIQDFLMRTKHQTDRICYHHHLQLLQVQTIPLFIWNHRLPISQGETLQTKIHLSSLAFLIIWHHPNLQQNKIKDPQPTNRTEVRKSCNSNRIHRWKHLADQDQYRFAAADVFIRAKSWNNLKAWPWSSRTTPTLILSNF